MILVDTSVWVEHLRSGNDELAELLMEGKVLCHPFVAGELACGNIRRRDEFLDLLRALPCVRLAGQEETLLFLAQRSLHGRGLGWIDVHLLASALLTPCRLWTLDKALHAAAQELGVGS